MAWKLTYSRVVHSLVKMNNDQIQRGIQRKFVKITDAALSLGVFFVSNDHYNIHLDGYDQFKIPLPLETTGIPTLRYRLSSIPAHERMKVLQHYFKGLLRGQLASMTIWCEQTATDRKDEIKMHVEKPGKVRFTSHCFDID